MSQVESSWSESYRQMVNRNVGFITAEQQERLRACKVAVFGAGGIGGTAFEVLVRAGIGHFSIVDRDVFEPTNLNRQILATRRTLGQRKIDVAADRAKEINPDVVIEKFDHIDEANIGAILKDTAAAVMGIDSLGPCITTSRKCRERGIPLVEGWALPYGDVRVFSTETPSLEEVYELGTEGRPVHEIPEGELKHLGLKVFGKLGQIDGVPAYYSPEVIEGFNRGRIVSFAPMVWLTAVLMALETIKVLLDWGKLALAPTFALYDPFLHRIPTSQG